MGGQVLTVAYIQTRFVSTFFSHTLVILFVSSHASAIMPCLCLSADISRWSRLQNTWVVSLYGWSVHHVGRFYTDHGLSLHRDAQWRCNVDRYRLEQGHAELHGVNSRLDSCGNQGHITFKVYRLDARRYTKNKGTYLSCVIYPSNRVTGNIESTVHETVALSSRHRSLIGE